MSSLLISLGAGLFPISLKTLLVAHDSGSHVLAGIGGALT